MKEFETLTEYQILKLAYEAIAQRMDREEKFNERFKKEHGRDNRINKIHLKMYDEQLCELEQRILEIELSNAE